MKKQLKFLKAWSILLAITYVGTAYYCMESNPLIWDQSTRGTFITISALCLIVAAAYRAVDDL